MPKKTAAIKTAGKTKKTTVTKPVAKKAGLMVERFAVSGEKKTPVALPFEPIKGDSQALIAQAVRVYQAAKRHGNASTKTRGEVTGSSRKIYRQKGTGKARHGSITAPIFVGGGIVFGPQPRNFSLTMPQKMRQKALFQVFMEKLKNSHVSIISDLESVSGKTKEMVKLLRLLEVNEKKILFVMEPALKKAMQSTRNIAQVTIRSAGNMSLLDVLDHEYLIVAEESMKPLLARFPKKINKL